MNPYKHIQDAANIHGFGVDAEDDVLWIHEQVFARKASTAEPVAALAAETAQPIADVAAILGDHIDLGALAEALAEDGGWKVVIEGRTQSGSTWVGVWTPEAFEEFVAPDWDAIAENGRADDATRFALDCFGMGEDAALEQHIAGLRQAHADRKQARLNRGAW